MLVNAVYFKGSWASKFDPAHTRPGTFHAAALHPRAIHAPLGEAAAGFTLLQTLGGAAAVRLDYGHEDGPFAALLVLPADAERRAWRRRSPASKAGSRTCSTR